MVDSGRGLQGDWTGKLQGPTGVERIDAVSSAAIDASVRTSYSAFENVPARWRDNLVRWLLGAGGGRHAPEPRARQLELP